MSTLFLGSLKMPHTDTQRQQEQSPNHNIKNNKMLVRNGELKEHETPTKEESRDNSVNKQRHQKRNNASNQKHEDGGDQASTQSSAGDSSEKNDAQRAAPTSSSQDSAQNARSSMIRKEEDVLPQEERDVPERGLFRKESSRKSVRILEPATGSSGRWSSDRSLDLGESNEEFIIDTSGNVVESTDRRRQLYERADSDESFTHRSFMHDLSEVPTEASWNKNAPRSLVWRIRIICGKTVENAYVQLGIILLIIINAIFMGIATFDFVTDNENVDKGFSQLDKAFLIVFTIELVLQLVYRSISYFTDAWLVFDFVIVIMSWSLESLQIVRAFRIFRAFRLVTRIGPLRELVMAIGAVMPRMYAIAMLLILIFYIFAVLFTELFSDINTEVNYFGSLDVSLFTCMQLMTLEWGEVAREVMEERSWAWAPILAFLSVTGFIVFNLIVAVVCDAVAVVDREVQAERLGEFETDTTKLEKAQERIWDMTEHVEQMMHSQKELQQVLAQLAEDLEKVTTQDAKPTNNPKNKSRRRLG
mmetsp:Transcript_23605/g.51148  ORF Transcript_23605/g.51148 Transcript_23605/m.51148 type:complete len:531 (+) Transcript_23605:236-1828(+)